MKKPTQQILGLVLGIVLFSVQGLFAWGATAHALINKNATAMIPPAMVEFVNQRTFFEDHASDADTRKSVDPTEAMKHFIDIDSYPDFKHLSHNYDSVVSAFGLPLVQNLGILPWAMVWRYDSLTQQLKRLDWTAAYQSAADLGHYVGDANIALHATKNYNGQQTGNTGIHSRYETAMIDSNFQEIKSSFVNQPVIYIGNPLDCIFTCILDVNSCADSIMSADIKAKSQSGWSGSGTPPSSYYTSLWNQTKTFTIRHLQRAADITADLWCSAWVDAGLLPMPNAVVRFREASPGTAMSGYSNSPEDFLYFTIDGRKLSALSVGRCRVHLSNRPIMSLSIKNYLRIPRR